MRVLVAQRLDEFEHEALGGNVDRRRIGIGIEERLAESGDSSEEAIRRERYRQTVSQVSVGNSITSLRFIETLDWSAFFDAVSQGRKSEPYQVCVGPPGKAATRCWKQTAKYGVGKLSFSFTLPAGVPLGELTARWLVGDRTVARWAFFYDRPQ